MDTEMTSTPPPSDGGDSTVETLSDPASPETGDSTVETLSAPASPETAVDAGDSLEREPACRVLKKTPVLCRGTDNESRQVILVSCDEQEATFLAMQPPSLGSTVHLKRLSTNNDAAEVTGLVVENSYNPSDVRRCGFSVLLVGGRFNDSLMPHSAMNRADQERAQPSTGGFERRRHPRIPVQLPGVMKIPGTSIDIVIGNLSMSGALIKKVETPFPDVIEIGTMLHLHILEETRAILLTLRAETARLIGVGSPSSLGLRFIDLTPLESGILEQLILNRLLES